MDTQELITVQEAAEILGVHSQTVRNALNEGRLPFTRALARIAIKRDDLEEYRLRTRPDGEKPRGRPRKRSDGAGDSARL